jgi:hypothetical protein
MIERHIPKMSCGVTVGIVIDTDNADDAALIAGERSVIVDDAAYRPETCIAAAKNEYAPWRESIRKKIARKARERLQ